jgi:hypothetical protein
MDPVGLAANRALVVELTKLLFPFLIYFYFVAVSPINYIILK